MQAHEAGAGRRLTKGNPSRAACAVTNVHDLRERTCGHAENGTLHTHAHMCTLSSSLLLFARCVCAQCAAHLIAHRPQHRPSVLEMREGERRPHVAYVCARMRTESHICCTLMSYNGTRSFFHPVVKPFTPQSQTCRASSVGSSALASSVESRSVPRGLGSGFGGDGVAVLLSPRGK